MEIDKIGKCLSGIIDETGLYEDYVSQYLIDKTIELNGYVRTCLAEEVDSICHSLLEKMDKSKTYTTIWIYSFVVSISSNPVFLEDLIKYVIENPALKANTCYFLYYQIKRIVFTTPILDTQEIQYWKWKLLYKTFHLFEKELDNAIGKIPLEERNPNMALVIIEQMLSFNHGPTKTALDRCYTLIKGMKKNTLLINTAEMLSTMGEIPFWLTSTANYDEELLEKEYLEWKGCKIPFFQCDNRMPDKNVLNYLVEVLQELKPSIVVTIGGSSIFAGLVNKMVPALTVGLTTSGIEATLADYQILQSQNKEMDYGLLNRMGKNTNSAIEGKFTFSIKQQEEFITREELGVSQNDFVLVLVGARLDYELSEEFLEMLGNLQDIPVKIIVMGILSKNAELQKRYPWFEKKVLYLGMCNDVLSRLELCDVYVNPTRKGGGTSCVEAMYKGLPVVSTTYGDVAGIAGEDFCCKDYVEMETLIRRYYVDKEFYRMQSEKALKIAEEYLDTEREFVRCVNLYLERIMEDE